ncbi:MAG: hypothetical protein HY909_27205 [Deltaproteobacteria bacterium]|nr:hypothetical protein [Deltaproteobacteria bacterium]
MRRFAALLLLLGCVDPDLVDGPIDNDVPGQGDTEDEQATEDSGLTPEAATPDSAAPDVPSEERAPDPDAEPPTDTQEPSDRVPPADVTAPDTRAPDTAVPDTARPDTARPDTAAPDTAPPMDVSMGDPCARLMGLYCGDRLGLASDLLIRCSGSLAIERHCRGRCLRMGDGGEDACPCPDGDGVYCGEPAGLDANRLYDCRGGRYTARSLCAGRCTVVAGAGADRCAACPSGNGLYCGGPLGADANVLYHCMDGVLSERQRCGSRCQVNPPGVPDACGGCPMGDGTYCGGSVGMDANTLYRCAGGTFTMLSRCPSTCVGAGASGSCMGTGMGLSCSNVQWWNVRLTYGPYRLTNGGIMWWDTDLAVAAGSRVQLRHDSRLVAESVQAWGWQPRFMDLTTGQLFQFLHLTPSARYTTTVGMTYPAGTVVGLSGGATADTGYPRYSTGAHLCVETVAEWRTAFPMGMDACR